MAESEMIERVAKAICVESGHPWEAAGQGYRETCTDFARAAIETMREPPEECPTYMREVWRDIFTAAIRNQIARAIMQELADEAQKLGMGYLGKEGT